MLWIEELKILPAGALTGAWPKKSAARKRRLCDGRDRATLEDWQARVGLSEVIKTRSQTWRTLDEAQRKAVANVSTDAAYERLMA